MKKLFSMLMLGLILVLFLFSGCSEKAEIPNIPENQPLKIMSLSEEGIDCYDWSFEELNEWAEEYISSLGICCEELVNLINSDECLKKWFALIFRKKCLC